MSDAVLRMVIIEVSILAFGGLVTALWRSVLGRQEEILKGLKEINGNVRVVEQKTAKEQQRLTDHLGICSERMKKVAEIEREQWAVINEIRARRRGDD